MIEAVLAKLRSEPGVEIGHWIGEGAAAQVYRGTEDGVPCAFKIFKQPIDMSEGWAQRELRNLELVRSVNGFAHIVTLFKVRKIDGHLVTQYELGQQSLLGRLKECQDQGLQGIPREELIGYMRDVAKAIDFLNGRGIFHRDVKPANVLLFHGSVKLIDLGLAKFVGATTRLTKDSFVGTLGYIPPEVADARPEDEDPGRLTSTSDLYSLAATYVKLRTGNEPLGDDYFKSAGRQRQGSRHPEGPDSHEGAEARKHFAV